MLLLEMLLLEKLLLKRLAKILGRVWLLELELVGSRNRALLAAPASLAEREEGVGEEVSSPCSSSATHLSELWLSTALSSRAADALWLSVAGEELRRAKGRSLSCSTLD